MKFFSINFDIQTRTAHVGLFGEIITGIGCQSVDDFAAQLEAFEPVQVELSIDCLGGDWDAGLKLFNVLKRFNVTANVSRCYSSAVLPLMAAQVRRINHDGRIMIHAPASCVYGDSERLKAAAVDLENSRIDGAKIIEQRTRQSLATVESWLGKDTWLDASEALQLGLVDEVMDTPAPRPARARKVETDLPAPMAKTEDEIIFAQWLTAFGKIEVSDRERFLRDLQAWTFANVAEKTICGCD